MQVWLILGLSYWRSQILSYVSLESSLSLICWLLLDFARKFELSIICVSVVIRRSPSVLSSYEVLRKGFDSLLFCTSLAVEGVNGSSPFSNRIVIGLFTSELSLLKWTNMRERTRVLLCPVGVDASVAFIVFSASVSSIDVALPLSCFYGVLINFSSLRIAEAGEAEDESNNLILYSPGPGWSTCWCLETSWLSWDR